MQDTPISQGVAGGDLTSQSQTPAYALNDEVRVVDSTGAEMIGVVVEEENADGDVLVEVGGRVLPIQREALDAMQEPKGDGGNSQFTMRNSQLGGENSQLTPQNASSEVEPVGVGFFGNIYNQFKGKVKDAIDFLLRNKEGEAVGALHHKDIGEISVVYGNDGYGLAHIAKKHPEVLNDLQGTIDGMEVTSQSDNRIVLESPTHRAVISKMLGNEPTSNWLLTAYEKKNPASASSSDIETEPEGKQNGTATLQNEISRGEDSENNSDMQEGGVDSQGIPVDAKGKKLYEQAPIESTINAIYNNPELDETEADALVAAKIDGATKRIAQLEKKKPKMGEDEDAYIAERAKWRERLESEQASLAYWQGVQAAVPEMRRKERARRQMEEEIAQREQERQKRAEQSRRAEERGRNRGDYRKAIAGWDDAPGSFHEYVAQALLTGEHKMRWNDNGLTRGLGSHTTGRRGVNRRGEVVTARNDESRAMSWLIDDRGGLSPEALADRLWNDYTGSYGEEMSEGSALDVLLDVVTSMPTPQSMWDYVKGEHDARMEAERGGSEQQYAEEEMEAMERDAMYRERYGVSEEEYWAREAEWDEFIESRQMRAEELENYDNFVAEERIKEEHERRNQENAEDEQRTDNSESEGGVEVLPGTQPGIPRGDEDVAGESEGVDGNGVESNDFASEETAELSEEDRQAIEKMPIPMLRRQIKETATALFEVSQLSGQWQEENKDNIERAKLVIAYAKEELARKERLKKSNKWGVKVGNTATPFEVVRKMFEEFNSNEDIAQLFEKVAEVFETLPIKVVFSDTIGTKSIQGWFSPTTGTMKLPGYFVYGGGISEQNKAGTILHEMIHAVTTYALYINEKPYLQTELGFRLSDDMHAAIRQLKRIYASIASDKDFKGEYGAVSVHEMIAELSNVQFREKLKKKGLWETIVDAIKRLFGITPSNALEGAEAALEYMLNNFDRSQWDKMVGMGEKRGKQMRIGVDKQIIGEKGASALDKAEEATHRMDNLGVAREDQIFLIENSGESAMVSEDIDINPLLNAVKTLYEKGKEFASKLFQRTYFDVARTPDFMKRLGLRGDKFTVKYGVIARHVGKDSSHDLSERDWKQLPQALQTPFAITKLKDKKDSYRIYTTLQTERGEYVVVGVDVKNAGRELEVNAVSTAFGRRNNANLPLNEEVIYTDTNITPNQSALLERPNFAQYPTNQELSTDKGSDNVGDVQEEGLMFRDGEGAMSDSDVSVANDPVAKVMGRSQRSGKQQAKRAERERKAMRNRVAELAEKMRLDNVEVVDNSQFTIKDSQLKVGNSQLSERKARAKGWFDTKTGRIVINLSNHLSVADVERTLLHEAVAHYGLRELFGQRFDTFLDNVFRNAEADVRAQIVELAKKHGWEFRTATEEYLAGLAEDTNFEYLERQTSFWAKIKRFFLDMLESIGWDYKGPELSDNELRYLLWRSYENMVNPGRHRSILGMAEDVAMRAKFGLGESKEERGERKAPIIENGELRVENGVPKTEGNSQGELSQVAEGDEMYSDGETDGAAEGVAAYKEKFSGSKELDIVLLNSVEEAIEFAMNEGESLETAKAGVEYVKQGHRAGGLLSGTNKIFIFAFVPNNKYTTLFHENAHYAIEKLGGVKRIKALVDELRELDSLLARDISKYYQSAAEADEVITYSLEIALYGGAIEELKGALTPKARWQLEQILDIIGYEKGRDYKQEVERYEPDPTSEQFRKRQTRTRRRIAERRGRMADSGGYPEGLRGETSNQQTIWKTSKTERATEEIGNGTDVDGDEGDIRFRDGDNASVDLSGRDRAIARDAYDRMMSSGRYQFTEAMQDSMMGLKLLYKAILGKKMEVEGIPDFENAYVAENLMSSQNAAQQREYYVKYMKPLLKAVHELAGADAAQREELTDYMMAKHGLERNVVMAEREAKRAADEAVKEIQNSLDKELNKYKKANELFNQQLQDFESNSHEGNLVLGEPSPILEACGIDVSSVFITPKTLKAHLDKHGLAINDIKDLPKALLSPLMVYEWGTTAKSMIVITHIPRGEQRITIAIKLERGGKRVEVNEIASIHGKDSARFIDEMIKSRRGGLSSGLKYVDKENALNWLGIVPPKGTAPRTQQERIANIIEKFENPTTKIQKIQDAIRLEKAKFDGVLKNLPLSEANKWYDTRKKTLETLLQNNKISLIEYGERVQKLNTLFNGGYVAENRRRDYSGLTALTYEDNVSAAEAAAKKIKIEPRVGFVVVLYFIELLLLSN